MLHVCLLLSFDDDAASSNVKCLAGIAGPDRAEAVRLDEVVARVHFSPFDLDYPELFCHLS